MAVKQQSELIAICDHWNPLEHKGKGLYCYRQQNVPVYGGATPAWEEGMEHLRSAGWVITDTTTVCPSCSRA